MLSSLEYGYIIPKQNCNNQFTVQYNVTVVIMSVWPANLQMIIVYVAF